MFALDVKINDDDDLNHLNKILESYMAEQLYLEVTEDQFSGVIDAINENHSSITDHINLRVEFQLTDQMLDQANTILSKVNMIVNIMGPRDKWVRNQNNIAENTKKFVFE